MKIKLSVIFLCFSFTASAQTALKQKTTLQNIKSVIVKYVKSDAYFPNSYISVGWSELGKLTAQNNSKFLEKTDDSVINRKIDTLIEVESNYFPYPDEPVVYVISHAFKIKTKSGEMTLSVYSFKINNKFIILKVDEGTPEEQIQNLKLEKAQMERCIVLIKQISDLKTAKIKSN